MLYACVIAADGNNLPVRHVIDAAHKNQACNWYMRASHAIVVHGSQEVRYGRQLFVSWSRGILLVDGKPIKDKQIHLSSDNGPLIINGIAYAGTVVIRQSSKDVRAIQYVDHHEQYNCSMAQSQWWQNRNVVLVADAQRQVRVRPVDGETVRTTIAVYDQADAADAVQRKTCIVRVLLDEKKGVGKHWNLYAPHGMVLVDLKTESKVASLGSDATVSLKNGHLYINNKKYTHSELLCVPRKGRIACLDAEYEGSMLIVKRHNAVMLINCLDLEDYLSSVVCFESWPGWPLEVNKVLAIASRSYVISMVLKAKNKKPYHVKNSNVHQTYGGFHTNEEFKRAVRETQGVFLAYNNKPIIAMFDCCCGGIVPAHMHGVDFSSAPYLARKYACTHCSDCKIFNWQATYPVNDLVKKLKKVAPQLHSFQGMHITERDQAGLVKKASIKSKKGRITVTGKQMYSTFKDIKSFHFDVSHEAGAVLFTGTGYGHHLGLCQWGAREMVRKGFDYKTILQFYYPGTTFMRLY